MINCPFHGPSQTTAIRCMRLTLTEHCPFTVIMLTVSMYVCMRYKRIWLFTVYVYG